uniref:Uncharacterized protein n=1 Tax=Parascaris univalens TaxID=6257 RepID=A0A915CDJ1_PARUN
MRVIIFTVAIICIFVSSTFEASRGVAARSAENTNDTAVVNVLEISSGSSNQTLFKNNGTNVAPKFDLTHPLATVEALYENSRERIHLWMEESTYSHMMILSALVGVLSAFVTLLLLYILYLLFRKCRSRRRQHKIVDIVSQLNDAKNPFETKTDDSDDETV